MCMLRSLKLSLKHVTVTSLLKIPFVNNLWSYLFCVCVWQWMKTQKPGCIVSVLVMS